METVKLQLTFMVYSACAMSFVASVALGQDSDTDEQYRKDMKRASVIWQKAAKAEVDPNTLLDFAADIENRWKDTDRQKYGRLMLRLMEPAMSKGLFNSNQGKEARKYLLLAVVEPENIPVSLHANLADALIRSPAKRSRKDTAIDMPENEWKKQRKENMQVIARLWKRMDDIEANWDPNDSSRKDLSPHRISFDAPGKN